MLMPTQCALLPFIYSCSFDVLLTQIVISVYTKIYFIYLILSNKTSTNISDDLATTNLDIALTSIQCYQCIVVSQQTYNT